MASAKMPAAILNTSAGADAASALARKASATSSSAAANKGTEAALSAPNSAPPTMTHQSDSLSRLPPDITSPHELTDWVDAVLDRLETKFQSANHQYEIRINEMSERIETLESSIQTLINGAVSTPPVATGGKSGSVSSKAGSEAQSPRLTDS